MACTMGFVHTEVTTTAELQFHSVPRAQKQKFLKEGPQISEFPSWGLSSIVLFSSIWEQLASALRFVLGFSFKQS